MTTTSSPPYAYGQRHIAFVDVLGFGSLISESGQSDALAIHTIKRVSQAIEWSIEELSGVLGPAVGIEFTQFSDSFVVSVDAERAGRHGLLMFSHSLLDVIDCFLSSKLLLRGGISSGKLIHTSSLLFGPAMNRAYELESCVARVPRIILDPLIPKLADIVLDGYLERDSDGFCYVDYFNPRKAFYLVPSWRHSIQCAIEAIPSCPKLREKREWLIEKYNAALSGFSYEEFKAKLDEYVNDTDANIAVVEDYEELLAPAKVLRRL